MSTAVAEPNTAETESEEPNLENLTLTAADLDSMTDDQIAERLRLIQLYSQKLRARANVGKARVRRIEKAASSVGALVSRSNDVARAEFNVAKYQTRLDNARRAFEEVQGAYLRVNEITELPADVQAQLDESRQALVTKMQTSASRVKATDEEQDEAAD